MIPMYLLDTYVSTPMKGMNTPMQREGQEYVNEHDRHHKALRR